MHILTQSLELESLVFRQPIIAVTLDMANEQTSLPTQDPYFQFSVLDFFFPGITGILTATEQLLAGRLNSYASGLCLCGILLYFAKHVSDYAWGFVDSHLTSKVQVLYSDEAYNMLIAWISSQAFSHNTRCFLARIGKRQMLAGDDGMEKKPLSYSPWNGTYAFIYKKRLYWFRSMPKETTFHLEEIISVSCLGRSPRPLQELLSHCRAEYLKVNRNNTSIFEPRDGRWKPMKTRMVRPISTVVMNNKEKEALLQDIAAYLNPEARVWYTNRGFPHQKGYLLYGPPGTGKSSLSSAIAGHFRLDIYMLNLSSVTGQSLGSLFAELPPRCVVLLEDIDAVDLTRSRQAVTKRTDKREPAAQKPLSEGLSELLNALDGVMSHEGRLLVMTTNHIERLDPALIRPGRADKKIELTYADRDAITQLFCLVFKRSEHDIIDHGKPSDDAETVERLASEFANEVPKREFSPAEIQSFLVENRGSALGTVQKAQAWVAKTREERRKRVDSSDKTFNATFRKDCQSLQTSATSQRAHDHMIVRVPDDLTVKDLGAVRTDVRSLSCASVLSESSSSESMPNTPPPSESDWSAENSK